MNVTHCQNIYGWTRIFQSHCYWIQLENLNFHVDEIIVFDFENIIYIISSFEGNMSKLTPDWGIKLYFLSINETRFW